MSLQVWMPLNGNLNNQGLDGSLEFANTASATVTTDGKIGSCYSFSATSGTGLLLSKGKSASEFMNTYINHHSWSLCAWIRTTSNRTVVFGLTYGLNLWCGSSNSMRLMTSAKTIFVDNPTPTNDGKWHHICATYDTVDNAINIYVDGIKGITSYYPSGETYASSWTNSVSVGRDFNDSIANSSFYFQGSMNDVRIYDHCLSAKEVKEISKELCLHYKLADPYIESTTNLYNGWSTNCYNGATNKYNYGTSTDVYYDNLDGIIRVRMGTNNLDAWPYVFFNNITPPSNGEYRTLSFDYYPTIKDKINFYTYNTSGTITWIANGVKGTGGNIPVNTNSWNHISVTIKNTGSSDSGYGYMRIGLEKHTSNTSNYWLFKNIQVEDKDHSTPFVIGSRNESTVYDCSGLANNGTKIGGVTPFSNPLPIRYDKSYDFDGNTGSIQIPNLSTLVPSGEFTMNCWIYHDDTWSSKGFETILGGPSGFELEAKNRSTNSPVLWAYSWGQGSATYELNKWNMITMTRNTSETKFYINGELKITGSAGTIPSGNYFIGAWNTSSQQNYKGKISDFRLYSTVLSVEDIKTLYNTSASIDKNGNMYAYEFKEE